MKPLPVAWFIARRAKRALSDAVARQYRDVKILSRYPWSTFWIATTTEQRAQELRFDDNILPVLRAALSSSGYSLEPIETVAFPILSQEIVDRDYAGRWQEAMEMP